MDPVAPSVMLKWLRAAGEQSRLRLLALCAENGLSVSDLAQSLKQSEARVSRHLRILCEAGLLERLREGQWVHYRATGAPEPASFLRGLIGQLDRRDAQLLRDRATARAVGAPSAERLGRALTSFAAASGLVPPLGTVLLVGAAHPELLESAARAARHCTVLVGSRRSAQAARALAERRGFACTVRQVSNLEVPDDADLTRAGAQFDAVLLDHLPVRGEALGQALKGAAQRVAPGGRLWIFEPYESLESSRERIVEHPLARLRRLLAGAGLACERLSPVEADGEHVLAALARPAAAAERVVQAAGAQQ